MSWSWTALRDSSLESTLRPAMKALERYLNDSSKYKPIQSVTRTTDATVTTLHTQSIPVDQTVTVEGFVSARRTGGLSGSANDGAGYRISYCAKNTTGTAAVIGAAIVTVLGESQAAWDVTVDATGGTIRVRVTGAVDNNVVWAWSGTSLSVKE